MSERYRRIFRLENPLYEKDAPLFIQEGYLLDTGDRLLCQLRFFNLGQRVITSATVVVTMLDETGAPLGSEVEYTYPGLRAEPDTDFGRGTAIVLPEAQTRAFRVRVREVIFAGNIPWRSAGGAWQPLPPHQTLEEHYGDPELAIQFRIRYGEDCTHAYAEGQGLWYCACGAINTTHDPNCRKCRRVRTAMAAISDEALRRECARRLKSEERRQAEAEAESAQRRKKRIILALVLTPLLVATLAAAILLPRNYLRGQTYRAAVNMLELGQFDRAAETFRSLEDYRDSAEQAAWNVPYQHALAIKEKAAQNDPSALIQIGRSRSDLNAETSAAMLLYEAAAAEFHALGGYKDSAEQEQECLAGIEASYLSLRQDAYDAAMALLDAESYSAAREAFLSLGDYSDSAEMAREAILRKAQALDAVVRRYDTSNIYASLSMSTGGTSRFSLPKAIALFLGSQCVSDLREACGADLVDVALSDAPARDMIPLADAVAELFDMAEAPRPVVTEETAAPESAEPPVEAAPEEPAPEQTADPLADYRMLCETGDVFGAYEWLVNYEGEFEDRDFWLNTLGEYMDFCTDWAIYSGDSTLIPYTLGVSEFCNYCSSRVLLVDGQAILRISFHGAEEYIVDLVAEPGERLFYRPTESGTYVATVINVGHLSYMRYNGQGKLASSCEYEHNW